MRKPALSKSEKKGADQLFGNCIAVQCLCFATEIIQFLYFLNQIGLGSLTGFFGPVFCQKSKKPLAVLPVIFSLI